MRVNVDLDRGLAALLDVLTTLNREEAEMEKQQEAEKAKQQNAEKQVRKEEGKQKTKKVKVQNIKEPRRDISSEIERVMFNKPYTIVFWKDGTKTVVKCQKGDKYTKEIGLAMAIVKKVSGNWGGYYEVFNDWCE